MEPSTSGLGSHGARVASPQSPILRVTWALYHVWKQLPKIVYTKLLTLPRTPILVFHTYAAHSADFAAHLLRMIFRKFYGEVGSKKDC